MRTDVYRDRRDRQIYAVADKTCNRGRDRQDSQTALGKAKTESDSGRQPYKTKAQTGIQTKQIIKTRLRGMRYIFNEDTQCNQDALTRYVRFTYTEVRKINVLSNYVT